MKSHRQYLQVSAQIQALLNVMSAMSAMSAMNVLNRTLKT
jgi:hypothetical protein